MGGSLICGAAQSSIMFILGRAVAGCGGAGILNGAFVIIAAAAPMGARPSKPFSPIATTAILITFGLGCRTHWYHPWGGINRSCYRPTHWGSFDAACELEMVYAFQPAFPVSWLYSNKYPGFYLNGPIGAITGISLAIIRIPNAKLETKAKVSIKEQLNRLDLPGCVLFSASVIMLLIAIDWGGVTYAWGSSTIISLVWGAPFVFCIFLFWEYRRGPTSLLPLGIFRNPIICCAAATSIMSYGGLYVIIMYLPLWFQAVKDVSPLTSGVDYLPSVATTTISTVLSGTLGRPKTLSMIFMKCWRSQSRELATTPLSC